MKIRFKNREAAIKGNLYKDEYIVLAREKNLKGRYNYIFFNDDLQTIRVGEYKVEVTDPDMSDMVQRNDLSYEQEFYINEFFIQLVPLEQGQIITTEQIWPASKAFRYFEKYNYEIPDSYRDKALNKNYKMNLIDGFLIAINLYIERKFMGGDYYEYFKFYKGKTISEIQLNSKDNIEELNAAEYKNLFKIFIEKTLYDTPDNEENSRRFSDTLFTLVDSLFIYDITRIFSYKTTDADCFVIEYQNEYYYLHQYWC